MTFSSNTFVSFVTWIAERLGLAFDLPESLLAGVVDEPAILEQLRYGRD